MAVLKLVGANRYMNKKASPIVIVRNGLTIDIQDEALVTSLLNAKRIDTLNNVHPMFELVVDSAKVEDVPIEPVVKPKTTRKSNARNRSN